MADLTVRDGFLVGITTGELPILHAERIQGPFDEDLLHTVEVRLRASRGSQLSAAVFAGRQLDPAFAVSDVEVFPEWNWVLTTPLVPGPAIRTYVMTPKWPIKAAEIRHLLLRPTDVADAEIEIESVRLIFRREYLSGIPSGRGWQGLGEIYRDTVVSRTPETIRYRLKLPSRPRLDLELGTLAPDPVTFHVAVTPEDGETDEVFARTITTAQRWETARVDLTAYSGAWVELTLALSSAQPGTLGLWGSSAIRDLGSDPVPRGVIVVIADNLRADHLDAYGYHRETAPVLTRMAAAGTRFESCIPLATWTKISVPSILTSLEPLTHGVLRFSDRLPPSAVTLAEVYRDAGYATVAYFSNLYAGQRSGTQQGFEVIHDDRSLEQNPLYWSKTARQYVDRLRPWLETHREVPFFVLLHVLDPHYPFEPLPPYDRLWADAERKAEHQRQTRAVAPMIANPFMRQLRLPTRSELEEAGIDPEGFVAVKVDWYDGSIRGLDVELGRLLEGLRELGLEESTLVAVISDHGEEFYEHGRLLHGHSVYGELTRVPLILRGPGVPAGVVVPQMVRTIDLMPTVLELSGLPLPEGIRGQSLVPLLRGDGGRFREQPALITRVYPEQNMQLMDTQIFALASGGFKLVELTERDAPKPRYELYDLSVDPLDLEDLAAQRPEVVERLREQLEHWRERAEAQRLAPAAEAGDHLSAEALERLRALGYIR